MAELLEPSNNLVEFVQIQQFSGSGNFVWITRQW